jgi:hypothetical protein
LLNETTKLIKSLTFYRFYSNSVYFPVELTVSGIRDKIYGPKVCRLRRECVSTNRLYVRLHNFFVYLFIQRFFTTCFGRIRPSSDGFYMYINPSFSNIPPYTVYFNIWHDAQILYLCNYTSHQYGMGLFYICHLLSNSRHISNC